MPNTFTLIASSTVGSGGASNITFSSIPATFTDLCVKLSGRSSRSGASGDSILISFNGSNSGSDRLLNGNGTSASSAVDASQMYAGVLPAATATASTFGNTEIYIPNYTVSAFKSFSVDSTMENNDTFSSMQLLAGLWSSTATINAVKLEIGSLNNFDQYSTAYLYGVKNA